MGNLFASNAATTTDHTDGFSMPLVIGLNTCHPASQRSSPRGVGPSEKPFPDVRDFREGAVLSGFPLQLSVLPSMTSGRLAFCEKAWRLITNDKWVLSSMTGCRLSFNRTPRLNHSPHVPKFSEQDENLIDLEIRSLLCKRAIVRVSAYPFPISKPPFHSPQDGGFRPVINLRALNQFLVYEHFKMEGIHSIWNLISQKQFSREVRFEGRVPVRTDSS